MAVNYTKNSHSVCQKLLIIVQKGFTEYGMSVSKEANQNMETSFKIKILYHWKPLLIQILEETLQGKPCTQPQNTNRRNNEKHHVIKAKSVQEIIIFNENLS